VFAGLKRVHYLCFGKNGGYWIKAPGKGFADQCQIRFNAVTFLCQQFAGAA
jgi:hypothetical protein